MDFLNDITERTIIVCPPLLKNKLLQEINKYDRLLNVKILSLNDLKKLVFFDYDENTILYLMQKYHFSYEASTNYLENMYYVSNDTFDNNNLEFLINIKKELIKNDLLIFNKLFVDSNINTPFIVFGYDYLDSFDRKILSSFNYKIIEKNNINNTIPVYGFKTLEEEVLYVIDQIISLINNNVSLNNIYLLNLDSNYNSEITRLFKMFKIPIDINNSSNILSTIIIKNALLKLKETKSFDEALLYLKSFNDNDINNEIYSKFLKIINKYSFLDYDFDLIIEAITYELHNVKVNNNKLRNSINVSSISNNYFNDDEYVFLLGFNQGSIPKVFKDEDYLSDRLKELLSLDTTSTINKYERNSIINNIKSIKNIIITYKEHYLDQEFYKTNLIDESCFKEMEAPNITYYNSVLYSNLKLSMMLDDLIKYDKYNDELSLYYNSFNIRYMEYDNSFKGIESDDLKDFINRKLTLSYSNINTFFECQFRYYLNNILKLNKYENSFDAFVGTLFHYVLSHFYDDDFDLDKYYELYIKEKEFNSKEKFYLNKLKKELVIICNRLKDFQNDTGLTNVITEKYIEIDKSTDIEVIFKGVIDKIMYKNYDNKEYISIIDYKTGDIEKDMDICNSCYGIGMQLIIYLYLISKKELFKNPKYVGLYLQKILSNEVNIEKNKNYIDIKYNNLKLNGYSINDELSISRFDSTYENSEYIRGMKLTKNGFSQYTKLLEEEDFSSLITLVDKKIDLARDKILDAEFPINPKWISNDKTITGCSFCKYLDICNRKNEDIVNLKKYKDLSFLKGELEND